MTCLSPKAAAALSDDFGDFEEAEMKEESNFAEDVQAAAPFQAPGDEPWRRIPSIHPAHGLPTSGTPAGRQDVRNAAPHISVPHHAASMLTEQSGGDEEGDEIPWYMDPASFTDLQGQTASTDPPVDQQAEPSHVRKTAVVQGSASSNGTMPHDQQRIELPEQPGSQFGLQSVRGGQAPPVNHSRFVVDPPDAARQYLQPKPGPALPDSRHQHPVGSPRSLPLPLLQALDTASHRVAAPEPAASSLPGVRNVLLEARAAALPEVEPAQQPTALLHNLQLTHQGDRLDLEAVDKRLLQQDGREVESRTEAWTPPLRSYSQAWTQMLEVQPASQTAF